MKLKRLLAAIAAFYALFSGCEDAMINSIPENRISRKAGAPPRIGGYHVYFGHLHNHSSVSDGKGTPSEAYGYAKDVSGLDFFGLADHAGRISPEEWAATGEAADRFNEDGSFVTFRGFEWTSGWNYGHVAVIGTADFCTESQKSTNNFDELCAWLARHDGIAFFNHPGREDKRDREFGHFLGPISEKVVGMELWNKDDGFSEYLDNDGYFTTIGTKGYYDEALTRGWKIGAAGSEDNHRGTWGSGNYRMAILASGLTRHDLMEAMKARRFYSTLDENLALSFRIDGNEMGSTVTQSGHLALEVEASDGDGERFSELTLCDGSGPVKAWRPDTAHVNIGETIETPQGRYCYIRIRQQDGSEAVSSPIWIKP